MADLLVSVQNAKEAKTAVRAGAGLIDAKSPAHGPLGRCSAETWKAIQATVKTKAPLSAALGEWHEWSALDENQTHHELSSLKGFTYAKLGPAESDDRFELWQKTFLKLKKQAPANLQWITVVYADYEKANSLGRDQILEFAIQSGCSGLLIDTYDKSSRFIWDQDWFRFAHKVKKQGLKLALAGGLTIPRIKQLQHLQPDWFAVRGSACKSGDRSNRVSYKAVNKLAVLCTDDNL